MRNSLLALCLVVASACPGSTAPAVDAPVDVDCGDRLVLTVRAPGVGYRPIADAADGAELVLGFQGFRYVYARGRLDVDPGAVSAAVRVTLDGGAPRSQPVQLAFGPAAGGGERPALRRGRPARPPRLNAAARLPGRFNARPCDRAS